MSVSDKDIEEAKKRVREMQSRANSFVSGRKNENASITNDSTSQKNQASHNSYQKNSNEQKAQSERPSQEDISQNSSEQSENDSQTFIILMLLLILSREKADGKLLLALLYLLM